MLIAVIRQLDIIFLAFGLRKNSSKSTQKNSLWLLFLQLIFYPPPRLFGVEAVRRSFFSCFIKGAIMLRTRNGKSKYSNGSTSSSETMPSNNVPASNFPWSLMRRICSSLERISVVFTLSSNNATCEETILNLLMTRIAWNSVSVVVACC